MAKWPRLLQDLGKVLERGVILGVADGARAVSSAKAVAAASVLTAMKSIVGVTTVPT